MGADAGILGAGLVSTLVKHRRVLLSVVCYSLTSSLLLLANKFAIYLLPSAGFITVVQLLVACAFLGVLWLCGLVKVEIGPAAIRAYGIYTVLFTLAVYANMLALAEHNVDTVIAWRSLTPLMVCGLEYQYMSRAAPSTRSLGALVTIVAGTTIFSLDSQHTGESPSMSSYVWLIVYVVVLAVEMVFGKATTRDVPVSLSTSVLLTNSFAVVPMIMLSSTKESYESLSGKLADCNEACYAILAFSSALGVGIGYAGWWCRTETAATTYTLVGILNKVLTVLLNILAWERHAGVLGTAALVLCLAGGSLYRQAPLREHVATPLPLVELDLGENPREDRKKSSELSDLFEAD